MKLEVLQDIQAGILPEDISSFDDLHDYVDANEYGGFTDKNSPNSRLPIEDMNRVQEAIHQWFQAANIDREEGKL